MTVNPDEMTEEQIEQAFEDVRMGREPDLGSEPEPDVQEVTEPEAVVEDAPATEEEEVTEEATPDPEPTPKAKATEQPDDQGDEEVSEMDIVRLELEQAKQAAKHWEQVAGRHGGRLGFLEQRLQALETAPAPAASTEDPSGYPDDEPVREPAARRRPPVPTDTDEYRAYINAQATAQGIRQFADENPDYSDHIDKIKETLSPDAETYSRRLAMMSPIAAQEEARRIYTEAYWHVKQEANAARVAELKEKRATQLGQRTQAKKQATVSGPGAAPPPKPKPKTDEDLSDEELDQALADATKGKMW